MAKPNHINRPRALALFQKFQLTETELAKFSEMHVQTIGRVLRGEHVHANSTLKVLRALEEIEAIGIAVWRAEQRFGKHGRDGRGLTIRATVDSLIASGNMLHELANASTRNIIQVSEADVAQLNNAIGILTSNVKNIHAKKS